MLGNRYLEIDEYQDLVLEVSNNQTGHFHEFKCFKLNSAIVSSESEYIYKSLKLNPNEK